ncbi:MAG TPA: hypothetical protein VFL42_12415 [Terriglobales bacterium]|nr:hypothetical protein [Terriglobales bacterium]
MRFVTFKNMGLAFLLALSASLPGHAQSQQKGFTEYETFQGTVNSENRVLKLDSTVGWDFNKNFGIFGGVPLYFSGTPSTTTATGTVASTSNTGMGNAYAGMVFRAPNKTLNYAGALTVYLPTGSTTNGFSSGTAGVDFSNHVAHSFHKFTPFFDFGFANTLPDSQFSTRQFASTGTITHLEEGADYEIVKHVYLGASGYQIVPFGSQTIFSRVDGGGGQGKNPFDNNAQATGNNLTREHGFNAWVGFEPSPLWRAEIGFTRSATFDLNSLAFNLRFNVGRMLRSRKSA